MNSKETFLKYMLGLEYDGSSYNGWQHQEKLPSIQRNLEIAISKVANETVSVVCAGRTDKGVHATEQVVHFSTKAQRSDYNWLLGINTYLPEDIRVQWVKQANSDFHARYSAFARRYRYIIDNHALPSPTLRNLVTQQRIPLDIDAMHKGGQYLIGEHDFSAFRGAHYQSKTPYRCITECNVYQQTGLIVIDITANAFLHHMVRNIAGVLIKIGKKIQPPEWAQTVLKSRNRCCADITAPPQGLYLVKVYYPLKFGLPLSDFVGPRFLPGKSCQPPSEARIMPTAVRGKENELVG